MHTRDTTVLIDFLWFNVIHNSSLFQYFFRGPCSSWKFLIFSVLVLYYEFLAIIMQHLMPYCATQSSNQHKRMMCWVLYSNCFYFWNEILASREHSREHATWLTTTSSPWWSNWNASSHMNLQTIDDGCQSLASVTGKCGIASHLMRT